MTTKVNYQAIYDEMRVRNIELLRKGQLKIDPALNSRIDKRRGLAYFAFDFQPSAEFKQVLEYAKKEFPDQSIYEPTILKPENAVLHFTFIQILKVGDVTENLPPRKIDQYITILKKILSNLPKFTIEYKGLLAIPHGLIIYGFPYIDINPYREKLRQEIQKSNLKSTEPFPINIAHSTFMRLSTPEDPEKLIAFADKFKQVDLGVMKVDSLQLCYGSWKMKHNEIEMIEKFDLK